MTPETTETIRLRVKPNVLLPHTIQIPIDGAPTIFTFKPECDRPLPRARAEALLKSYPGVFEIAKGPFSPSDYRMKKSFKKEVLLGVVDQLSDEEMLSVYDYAQNLLTNRGKAAPGAENEAPKLAEMTKAQLIDLAEQMKLEVPAGATKAELIELIEGHGDASNPGDAS